MMKREKENENKTKQKHAQKQTNRKGKTQNGIPMIQE